jgi:hypothetical protein
LGLGSLKKGDFLRTGGVIGWRSGVSKPESDIMSWQAPRAINRWGTGSKVVRLGGRKTPEWSAFVGFMKSSKAESVAHKRRK